MFISYKVILEVCLCLYSQLLESNPSTMESKWESTTQKWCWLYWIDLWHDCIDSIMNKYICCIKCHSIMFLTLIRYWIQTAYMYALCGKPPGGYKRGCITWWIYGWSKKNCVCPEIGEKFVFYTVKNFLYSTYVHVYTWMFYVVPRASVSLNLFSCKVKSQLCLFNYLSIEKFNTTTRYYLLPSKHFLNRTISDHTTQTNNPQHNIKGAEHELWFNRNGPKIHKNLTNKMA